MNLKKVNQAGFVIIELIVLVLVVGILVTTGYLTYKAHQTNSKPATTQVESKPSSFKPELQLADFSSSQVPAKPSLSKTNGNVSDKAHSSLAQYISTNGYQGVRLEDGTIYIGKLSEPSVGHLELKDVFILVSSPCPGSSAQSQICVSLRVNQADPITIATESVAVWQNLPTDNMFVKAIIDFKASQKH